MLLSAPQPDHAAPIVQDLLEWVPKHCVGGTNGSSATPTGRFLPLPDLKAYLNAEKRIIKLLRALYHEREDQVIDIDILEKWYIRVFTILILIGKGRYIEHFSQHHNLRDPQLPFLEKPAHFPIDPNDPYFWQSFYDIQFAFCAHYFRYNENQAKLEDLCILPILSKEVLGQGGSAAIYKIKLHPYYDQLDPATEVSSAYGDRPANTYVLKTYNTKDASTYFNNEVDAFKKLATKNGSDRSLIQFLGSYRQGDTYNILLEYADRGTLEDFFRHTPPPSLGEDIVMFWDRLFNVIKALSRIHASKRPDGFHGPDILIGWHQDVKPSNILVLSGKSAHPYDVEFKLADLGLSHFKRTLKLDQSIVDNDIGGTKEYGAPECSRTDEFLAQSKLTVKPSIDIWSFGGVCSEAAVWVVLGKAELDFYRLQRKQEICQKGTLQDGGCFHNGEKILNTVEAMHRRLLKREEVRPGDRVTIPVLEHMVTSMLEEEPDGRQNAIWLYKKSQKILKEAQSTLKESHQPTTPPHRNSFVNQGQSFGMMLPETSLPPLSLPPREGSSPEYDPSLHDPQYSSKHEPPEGSLSVRPRIRGRSITWHEPNTNQNMNGSSLSGDQFITTDEANQSLPFTMPNPPFTVNTKGQEPPVQKTRAEKPYLSYRYAKQLREERSALPPPQEAYLNDLKNRDHVFIMDDSVSMKPHWNNVISLFSILAYIAKRLDKNGVEMYFTVSESEKTFKDTSRVVKLLRSITPTSYSNIDMRLGQILRTYQAKLEHEKEPKRIRLFSKPVKPLSLYIFTDGAWQGCDAVPPIEAMIESLKRLGFPKEQVGIQFVRFGNKQEDIEKLEYLDSGLRKKHTKKWDIVDTEPFPEGNLLKMLLGAISPWFDDDDDGDKSD